MLLITALNLANYVTAVVPTEQTVQTLFDIFGASLFPVLACVWLAKTLKKSVDTNTAATLENVRLVKLLIDRFDNRSDGGV